MFNRIKFIIIASALICLGLAPAALWAANSSTAKTEGRNAVYVLLNTNFGDITLELDAEKAPKTVENFVQYVKDGHYDGTIFHRVIADFMVQGGGFDAEMKEKQARAPIDNEADNGLTNDQYTIAMARTMEPHSATAQFFINVKDNKFLNHTEPSPQGWGYAVFGKVIKGMDVVDKIKMVETTSFSFHDDVPKSPVIIEKASIIEQK